MKNFYKEHKGYLALEKELDEIDCFLSRRLLQVVGDAIMYGLEEMEKKLLVKKKR